MLFNKTIFIILVFSLICCESEKKDNTPFLSFDLDNHFYDPPPSASPWVYWHWMNGNVTKEGIKADLEDMKRVGIGGVMLFDGGLFIPEGPVRYGSDSWYNHVRYAVKTADELGIKFGIMNCPGWATAGGPWISPEQSMKMLVWNKTFIEGGKRWRGKIETPPSKYGFYKDIALLAVKEKGPPILAEKNIDSTEILFSFNESVEARLLTIPACADKKYSGRIEVSNNGKHFRTIHNFEVNSKSWLMPIDIPFLATRAANFRLKLKSGKLRGKVILSNNDRINNLSAELGFHSYPQNFLEVNDNPLVIEEYKNISHLIKKDGSLEWDVPEGNWSIIRLGYTTTGATNHPAAKEGTGLEVDKFDSEAITHHFNKSLGRIIDDSHIYLGNTFTKVVIDSWEAESQNWTESMFELFEERKGYSLSEYLLCLTGYYVNSKQETNAFFRDFRSTLGDLYADVFFGTMSDLAHNKGLKVFAEPYGGLIDKFKIVPNIDVPATEFWNHDLFKGFGAAVSVAHTTGKNVIMAEAFTSRPPHQSRWKEIPSNLKVLGDIAYTTGVNLFVLHSYVHQPRNDVFPGFTLGRYGTHFGIGNSWWQLADGWIDYLRRCQYLLQYGKPVADFLFLVTEELSREKRDLNYPWLSGYKGDYLSINQLKTLSVQDGKLITPGGHSYRVLFLPDKWRASTETISCLKKLSDAGAKIIGTPPFEPEGIVDIKDDDQEWKKSIENWEFKEFADHEDFVSQDLRADSRLRFTHRADNDMDIYFIVNPTSDSISDQLGFRITGRKPELWDAVSGKQLSTPSYTITDSYTHIDINLIKNQSLFVVFRKKTESKAHVAHSVTKVKEELITGKWTVIFERNRGAPKQIQLNSLYSFTEHKESGVKYFSGLAEYKNDFVIDNMANLYQLDLGEVYDLAEVKINGKKAGTLWSTPFIIDITEFVNEGKNELSITVANRWINRLIGDEQMVKENIKSKNNSEKNNSTAFENIFSAGAIDGFPEWWSNPAIKRHRITFTTWNHYEKTDDLVKSGVIGPVRIISSTHMNSNE